MSIVADAGGEGGFPRGLGLTRRAGLGAGATCLAWIAYDTMRPAHVAAATRPAPVTDTSTRRRHVQPEALFRIRTRKPIVALSFDDGPDPAHTPQVLEILHEHGAKATFFCVGLNALA